jgi:hypothetical protein
MGSPPRLRPGTSPQTFRIPPRGGHPVLRLSSRQTTNLGASPWLYPSFPTSCPFRVLLINAPRPTRRYPRLWIWRPSSEHQRDFNPPDLGAAQHTLRVRLTSPRRASRPCRHQRSPTVPYPLGSEAAGISRFSRLKFSDMPGSTTPPCRHIICHIAMRCVAFQFAQRWSAHGKGDFGAQLAGLPVPLADATSSAYGLRPE